MIHTFKYLEFCCKIGVRSTSGYCCLKSYRACKPYNCTHNLLPAVTSYSDTCIPYMIITMQSGCLAQLVIKHMLLVKYMLITCCG